MTEEIEKVEKTAEEYSDQLSTLEREKKEHEQILDQKNDLEFTVKDTTNVQENIKKFLEVSEHPRSGEYVDILDSIKTSGYGVKDENAHSYFVASKLFLSSMDLPSSLRPHFETLQNSKSVTPSNKESLEKIKPFIEKEIEKKMQQTTMKKLSNDYGEKNIMKNDFSSVTSAFDHGKISIDEYNKAKKEFLDATALKRKYNLERG